jgi:hypothetical protein
VSQLTQLAFVSGVAAAPGDHNRPLAGRRVEAERADCPNL